MNLPVNQQHQLIKEYFNCLVKEFITDPLHNKNISIVFVKDLGSEGNIRTLGLTEKDGGIQHWKVDENGVEVPGSWWQEPFIYTISFLNHYKDKDGLRGAVVHEFTHLYLYSKVPGKHKHDDRFYSTMEKLESWFDKNQNLKPRVDKSGDRFQYVGDNNSEDGEEENTCPECSYPSPQHSPKCSHKQGKPHSTGKPKQRTDITNDPQKAAEFNRLIKQLETSKDLLTLETVYKNAKNNPLYKGESGSDNKKKLDDLYQLKKCLLQTSNRRSSTNDSNLNNGRLGTKEYFLITLAIVGVILIVVIGYLALSNGEENRSLTNKKKKR